MRYGGQKARRTGENAKKPLKPSRGECRDVSAEPVVPAACIFFAGGPWGRPAPGIPRALCLKRAGPSANLGREKRAARRRTHVSPPLLQGAPATKQSRILAQDLRTASAVALGLWRTSRFARNDRSAPFRSMRGQSRPAILCDQCPTDAVRTRLAAINNGRDWSARANVCSAECDSCPSAGREIKILCSVQCLSTDEGPRIQCTPDGEVGVCGPGLNIPATAIASHDGTS